MAEVRRVTRKEAATELGVSRQRVEQLLKRWPEVEARDGIDIERLKKLREENADPLRQAVYQQTRKLEAVAEATPAAPKPQAKVSESAVGAGSSFTDARAARERSNARLAELKVLQEEGRLIPRDVVHAREFAVARVLRDRIIGFPAKLQQFLPPEAMQMLTEECRALVKEMQDDAARIAAQEF
jgi:hypothetical protein